MSFPKPPAGDGNEHNSRLRVLVLDDAFDSVPEDIPPTVKVLRIRGLYLFPTEADRSSTTHTMDETADEMIDALVFQLNRTNEDGKYCLDRLEIEVTCVDLCSSRLSRLLHDPAAGDGRLTVRVKSEMGFQPCVSIDATDWNRIGQEIAVSRLKDIVDGRDGFSGRSESEIHTVKTLGVKYKCVHAVTHGPSCACRQKEIGSGVRDNLHLVILASDSAFSPTHSSAPNVPVEVTGIHEVRVHLTNHHSDLPRALHDTKPLLPPGVCFPATQRSTVCVWTAPEHWLHEETGHGYLAPPYIEFRSFLALDSETETETGIKPCLLQNSRAAVSCPAAVNVLTLGGRRVKSLHCVFDTNDGEPEAVVRMLQTCADLLSVSTHLSIKMRKCPQQFRPSAKTDTHTSAQKQSKCELFSDFTSRLEPWLTVLQGGEKTDTKCLQKIESLEFYKQFFDRDKTSDWHEPSLKTRIENTLGAFLSHMPHLQRVYVAGESVPDSASHTDILTHIRTQNGWGFSVLKGKWGGVVEEV
eukprot:GDKI01002625.1.p1 GENE.GDKI01002625.1~~GDKI01002625.1.p1  ORF type:complete len:525 (-),score=105.58 GDKI01002625.1:149-1723(-)